MGGKLRPGRLVPGGARDDPDDEDITTGTRGGHQQQQQQQRRQRRRRRRQLGVTIRAVDELSGLAVLYLASHDQVRSVVLKRCSPCMSIIDKVLLSSEFVGNGIIRNDDS
jgi:hypothetical protein